MIQILPAHATSGVSAGSSNGVSYQSGSPQIMISRDAFSPTSKVDILIRAPDFNSNQYGIDTIGEDGSKVIISTRESSIPYRLVETGPDTGEFAGYVILSSTTSVCSPVCGPTDGFLAAGGDDAITVSLVYPDGSSISSTSYDTTPTYHNAIPEFPYAELILITSMISLIFFFKIDLRLI
ncbi:MAG: hypothetical protein KGI28_06900 [Thaumarchaeota archaeon]|nr:hypothetical protein [Nitrososphaerota archaeon]